MGIRVGQGDIDHTQDRNAGSMIVKEAVDMVIHVGLHMSKQISITLGIKRMATVTLTLTFLWVGKFISMLISLI